VQDTPDHAKPDHSKPEHTMVMYKQRREPSTTEVILTQSSFFGTLSISYFFKEAQMFLFSSKQAPNVVDPLRQAILSDCIPHKQ
jgi:hypothetical protein